MLPIFACWEELQKVRGTLRQGGRHLHRHFKELAIALEMKFKILLDVVDVNFQNKVKPYHII